MSHRIAVSAPGQITDYTRGRVMCRMAVSAPGIITDNEAETESKSKRHLVALAGTIFMTSSGAAAAAIRCDSVAEQ